MKALSIKTRLALVLPALIALLTGVGALGLVGNLRSNAALRETFSNNLPFTRALGLVEPKLAQARTVLDHVTLEPDPSKSADTLGRIATQIENSEKVWKDYLALSSSTPEEERIADEAGKRRSLIIKGGIDGAIGTLRHGDKDATCVLVPEKTSTQFHVCAEQSDRLNAIQEEVFSAAYAVPQSFFNELLWTFDLVIAAGLALVAGCYAVFSRAILRPLAEMFAHFHEISSGSLTTDVCICSRDEIDLLMEDL